MRVSTCRLYTALEPQSGASTGLLARGEPIEHHQIGPHTDYHRPVLHQSGTDPYRLHARGSRPAQETLHFGVLRPWFSVPCIWGSYDAGGLRRGTGRMLWQACASFQAVPTAWLGSRGHEAALVVRWQHGIALRQR